VIAVVEWNSFEEAQAFLASDAYKNLVTSREAGSNFRAFIVEGQQSSVLPSLDLIRLEPQRRRSRARQHPLKEIGAASQDSLGSVAQPCLARLERRPVVWTRHRLIVLFALTTLSDRAKPALRK
jgi:hypothetical protein